MPSSLSAPNQRVILRYGGLSLTECSVPLSGGMLQCISQAVVCSLCNTVSRITAYPSRFIQGKGGIVLELDDACQLLDSLQYCGGDIICQLLEGLVKEVDNGCQLALMNQSITLVCAWKLHSQQVSAKTTYTDAHICLSKTTYTMPSEGTACAEDVRCRQ